MKYIVLIVTVVLLVVLILVVRHFMNKNVRTFDPKDSSHAEPKEPVDADIRDNVEPKEKADYASYEKKPRRQTKKKQ